jgi:hypothetical protein
MNAQDAAGVFLGAVCVGILIGLAILICYLLTLQKALSRVSRENRTMEPGMVWLSLVPCVNIVWQFMIATRVPESLKNEFRARGRDDGSDYGKTIALTAAILSIVGMVLSYGSQAAMVGRGDAKDVGTLVSCGSGILGLIQLALLIIFWVKVANYSSQLAQDPGRRDYPDDYDRRFRDYDDEPRRPPPGSGPAGESPETFRPEDGGQYR